MTGVQTCALPIYLAGLVALEQWYRQVRRPFFEAQDLGPLVYSGALEVLASARSERAKRLAAMVANVSPDDEGRAELRERIGEVIAVFEAPDLPAGDEFLAAWRDLDHTSHYITSVQRAPAEVTAAGTRWLQQILDDLCARAGSLVPSMRMFAAG